MNDQYEFKKGDQVPAWVLHGPNEQRQKDAVFGCDVTIYYLNDSYFVRVEGRVPLGGCMAYIPGPNNYEVWEGSPTEWIDLNKSPYLQGAHYGDDSIQILHYPKGESHE